MHQRNLGYPLDGNEILGGLGSDVDKSSQAIVLAEIAARSLVARRPVFDFPYCIQADEGRTLTVPPQAQRFLRRADCAGLSAVLVHDDFRLLPGGPEAIANEVHFRFHHSKIILRAALQDKARA